MKNYSKPRRRDFVMMLSAAIGTLSIKNGYSKHANPSNLSQPVSMDALTIENVIDRIIQEIPGGRKQKTVDTVKIGDPSQEVSGIVTTFMANLSVLKAAAEKGANFVISHEPIFYNHLDETDWLKNDKVFEGKRKFLEESRIVVWRCHDYWHTVQPDPVTIALIEDSGWKTSHSTKQYASVLEIPQTRLSDLVKHLKKQLNLPMVRFVGNPNQICRKIGVAPGAAGGRSQIGLMMRENVDVLICGEISEWETSEYVRDSVTLNRPLGLIITGHVHSEDPGMRIMADWLKKRFSGFPIEHIPSGDPFHYA